MPINVTGLNVEIFADGADLETMVALAADRGIKGFTTNPTLMRQAGISDYEGFGRKVLEVITDRPISFEVFSDDFVEMERQARFIASWGPNVFVKVPVTNTQGDSSRDLVRKLSGDGVQLNVTALMTIAQVEIMAEALQNGPSSFVSVFAGRIADTGVDPIPAMRDSLAILRAFPQLRLIWASPREVLNIVQAHELGCHVITVTNDLLKKLPGLGKDLTRFSLETVDMFFRDGLAAGYTLAER